MINTVKVTIFYHGEALQETDGNIAGFSEGELLTDADAGSAIELLLR